MNKRMRVIFTFSVLAAVAGLTGCSLFSDVELPGAVPSGFVYLDFSYESGFSSDSRLWIAFDPDTNISDGDEYTLSMPLGDYLYSTDGYDIHVVLPWSAPDVPVGNYYVYCWIDVTADGQMDAAEAQNYAALHGASVGYELSTELMTIVHNSVDYPETFPTFRVDGGPAPQIDFVLTDNIPL